VVVLSGGRSSEREISLQTGRELVAALELRQERLADLRAVEIDERGRWVLDGRALTPAEALQQLPEDTIYFLGLHGGEGENGAIQGLLEASDRAFTGSGVGASALCMNKFAARETCRAVGIRVAEAVLIGSSRWRGERESCLAACEALGPAGWFVKPNEGGSSVATRLVSDASQLAPAIEEALATGDRALVEARVEGVECSCGVLGNADGELRALPPIEIRPHAGRFFDYEEKYSEGGADELCPAESFGDQTARRVMQLALEAHSITRCEGYSRTDFIVPADGEPVFLEVNTLPGFTARSLFPQEAQVVGIEFPDLLLEILELAAQRQVSRGER
jgi:D-alanine-D-alanine ligase